MYELEPGVLYIVSLPWSRLGVIFPLISAHWRCVFFALIRDNICLAPMILLTLVRANAVLWLADCPRCCPLIGHWLCTPSLTLTNKTHAYNSPCLKSHCGGNVEKLILHSTPSTHLFSSIILVLIPYLWFSDWSLEWLTRFCWLWIWCYFNEISV